MSLLTELGDAFTRVGTEFKAIRVVTGSLASLTTTDKASLVAAINEVDAAVGGAGVEINDTTPSTETVYSSTKVNTQITSAINGLVNGAATALDTLSELAAALGGDANFATTTATALGNRVRFDASQTLSGPQQAQVHTNIGVLSAAAIGNPDTDLQAIFEAALV